MTQHILRHGTYGHKGQWSVRGCKWMRPALRLPQITTWSLQPRPREEKRQSPVEPDGLTESRQWSWECGKTKRAGIWRKSTEERAAWTESPSDLRGPQVFSWVLTHQHMGVRRGIIPHSWHGARNNSFSQLPEWKISYFMEYWVKYLE